MGGAALFNMKQKDKDVLFKEKLLSKLLSTIEKHFPKLEEKATTDFEKEIKKYHKEIDDSKILFFLFVRWFLLKYKVGDYFTLIDFLSTNPDLQFLPREMEFIRNIQEFKESLFIVKEISAEGKIVKIRSLIDRKDYQIIMVKPFKQNIKEKVILATIVKRANGDLFFFGPVLGYTKEEADKIKKEFFIKK